MDSDRVSRAPPYSGGSTSDYLISIKWLSHSMAQLPSCIHLSNNFVTDLLSCNLAVKSHNPSNTTLTGYHVLKV